MSTQNQVEPGFETAGDGGDSASRRLFMLASLGVLLTGCSETRRSTTALPDPVWDPAPVGVEQPSATPVASPRGAMPVNAIDRSRWASGSPQPRLMNRMAPVRYITVHHDGMSPFLATSDRAAASRLDSIRRAHRGRGWGDIGYHFAVDRGGRVWVARPLAYQGAHVKDHNVGNIGIVALGNFDRQSPSRAQVQALDQTMAKLMRAYNVPVDRVRTHQEWAATACPGRSMQRHMGDVRPQVV